MTNQPRYDKIIPVCLSGFNTMKPLTRDILTTLIVKLSLLFILWLVCFKNVIKPTASTKQWLLGPSLSAISYNSLNNKDHRSLKKLTTLNFNAHKLQFVEVLYDSWK